MVSGKPKIENVWRAHVGGVAWPTVALAGVVVVASAAVVGAAIAGRLPWWLAFPIQTLLAYLAFTPVHEAVHGNISGGHRPARWLDSSIGWICGVMLLAPYPAFQALHLRHHAHTNDPDRDPDHWVAHDNPLVVALRCITILPHYDHWVLGGHDCQVFRRVRGMSILGLGSMIAAMIALTAAGFGWEVLTLWLGPAVLASGLLAFLFDWLPHAPHVVRERYRDTRVLLGFGLGPLLLNQNLHLIHHLWPRVPFYRYGKVFTEVEDELRARGARIDVLGAPTTG